MTILIFIIVLSVIIFVHELGHFVMARRAGIKVEEFGFGFPPRLWGYKSKKSGTIYSINWIPFGGFVKPKGEDDSESRELDSFGSKGFVPRAGVIVAGVVMNVLLAFVLLSAVNAIGSRVPVTDDNAAHVTDVKIQITSVAKDSPADAAGLKPLDEIVGFESVERVQTYIAAHKGQRMELAVRRDGQPLTIIATPRTSPPPGEGALGVALAKTGELSYPIHKAVWHGAGDTLAALGVIVEGFAIVIKNLVVSGKAGVELAGPVGIAIITGEAARLGIVYLLQFVAFISLNLAVINIVPFPALDGGRLLFLAIEKIKGSPISKKWEANINTAGFALLLLLMFYITAKDVLKFL